MKLKTNKKVTNFKNWNEKRRKNLEIAEAKKEWRKTIQNEYDQKRLNEIELNRVLFFKNMGYSTERIDEEISKLQQKFK